MRGRGGCGGRGHPRLSGGVKWGLMEEIQHGLGAR